MQEIIIELFIRFYKKYKTYFCHILNQSILDHIHIVDQQGQNAHDQSNQEDTEELHHPSLNNQVISIPFGKYKCH